MQELFLAATGVVTVVASREKEMLLPVAEADAAVVAVVEVPLWAARPDPYNENQDEDIIHVIIIVLVTYAMVQGLI